MRADGYGAALLLLAVLGWNGPAGAAETTILQSRQLVDERPPMSTRCMARCDELERTCEEHERLRPTCSVVNICAEEKLQCEALCRPKAFRTGRARL
jgi:hypothetical protein